MVANRNQVYLLNLVGLKLIGISDVEHLVNGALLSTI
jgi:hypothetical protein